MENTLVATVFVLIAVIGLIPFLMLYYILPVLTDIRDSLRTIAQREHLR
jgi:hypothetical protein